MHPRFWRHINYLLGLSLLVWSLPAHGQQAGDTKKLSDVLSFKGYIKDLQVLTIAHPDLSTTYNFIHNRLNLKYYPSGTFTAALEVRNRIYFGSDINRIPDFSDFVAVDNGYFDFSAFVIKENSVLAVAQIDRLWLDWYKGDWQVRIGRQRINWGKTLVWNPNDLFNSFNFTDFDYEEQPGSDALKVVYYPTGMSSIEAAVKPGKNSNETVAAGMWRFNRNNYDLQVLTGVYKSDLAFGLGWAGNLKNAGFKGEATWFQPKKPSPTNKSVLSAALTVDYSFEKPVYIQGGVLYNQHSDTDSLGAGSLNFIRGQELSPKNLMPSDWSFIGQINGNITPLFQANLAVIQTISPAFTFVMPTLSYSVFDNLDITLVDQSVILFSSTRPNNLHSLFLRLKWSF
jgi:hypothetical protein